jgi:hypothetical protein
MYACFPYDVRVTYKVHSDRCIRLRPPGQRKVAAGIRRIARQWSVRKAFVPFFRKSQRIIVRKALVIDCAELNKATSDTRLVTALAHQTGYRPIFSVFNSLTNLIDIASVGVIGQKGWSCSFRNIQFIHHTHA